MCGQRQAHCCVHGPWRDCRVFTACTCPQVPMGYVWEQDLLFIFPGAKQPPPPRVHSEYSSGLQSGESLLSPPCLQSSSLQAGLTLRLRRPGNHSSWKPWEPRQASPRRESRCGRSPSCALSPDVLLPTWDTAEGGPLGLPFSL